MNGPDRPMPPSEDLPEPESELRDLAVLALGGAFVPGRVGDVSEVALLVVLIGAPVLRVAWLTVDWARERDRVFVGLGLVLLAVLAASGLIKFL